MMDESVNMPSVVEILIDLFRDAIAQAYPDLPDPPCPVAPSAKQGDYQFNGAMPIAGLLKVSFLFWAFLFCGFGLIQVYPNPQQRDLT